MNFDRFGHIFASVTAIMFSLVIDVELVQEVFHVALVLDGHEVGFRILGGI